MPLGTNAVFALWTLVNSRVDDEPAEFWPMEPDELRERVTGRDVTALDRALKREDVRDIDLLPRG